MMSIKHISKIIRSASKVIRKMRTECEILRGKNFPRTFSSLKRRNSEKEQNKYSMGGKKKKKKKK